MRTGESGAGRDESAVEGAARAPVVGGAAVAGDELERAGRYSAGRAEPDPVVGREGLERGVPEDAIIRSGTLDAFSPRVLTCPSRMASSETYAVSRRICHLGDLETVVVLQIVG